MKKRTGGNIYLYECYYRVHYDKDSVIQDEENKTIDFCECGAKMETIGFTYVTAKTELDAITLASSVIDTSNREGNWDVYKYTLPKRGICKQIG